MPPERGVREVQANGVSLRAEKIEFATAAELEFCSVLMSRRGCWSSTQGCRSLCRRLIVAMITGDSFSFLVAATGSSLVLKVLYSIEGHFSVSLSSTLDGTLALLYNLRNTTASCISTLIR